MGYLTNYGALVGKSHGSITPCQDYASSLCENGVTAIALSDGCGSSPISQFGSERTVSALLSLLTKRFDELARMGQAELRKAVVDEIAKGILSLISERYDLVEEYKARNPLESQKKVARHGEEDFAASLFYATALFAAEKDGIWILGRIGDGVLGALTEGKMKIVLEEEKDEEKNGTFYPYNIYSFAKKDPAWYCTNRFAILKTKAPIDGVVLTSDGVDSLFDQRTPFQKKYAPAIVKIVNIISSQEDFTSSQAFFADELLPLMVKKSSVGDDCSIATMLKKGSEVKEIVVKEYPHPKKGGESSSLPSSHQTRNEPVAPSPSPSTKETASLATSSEASAKPVSIKAKESEPTVEQHVASPVLEATASKKEGPKKILVEKPKGTLSEPKDGLEPETPPVKESPALNEPVNKETEASMLSDAKAEKEAITSKSEAVSSPEEEIEQPQAKVEAEPLKKPSSIEDSTHKPGLMKSKTFIIKRGPLKGKKIRVVKKQ